MKKLLSAFVCAVVCGSSAVAVSSTAARAIVLNGDVIASEIMNNGGNLSEVYVDMIIRHDGELYNCMVGKEYVLCWEFGKLN